MDLEQTYQYTRLQETGAIRLIILQPSPKFESALQCTLIHTTLAECNDDIVEHYVALSYVWGNPNDRRRILIDGKPLWITVSLDSALRHIREQNRVVRMWADGICINQDDIEDRNQQVRLMGDIYSHAKHTIIFLGPSSSETDWLLGFIRSQKLSTTMDEQTLIIAYSELLEHGVERIAENQLLAQPWFTRVWVLQELVLSIDPWVQCGRTRVRWDDFCRDIIPRSDELHPLRRDQWQPDSWRFLWHEQCQNPI